MKQLLLFIMGFLPVTALFSQTNVSGGIYSNTTWTKANSPYIVVGDIVVFPDKILTIEPGVEVKFNGFYYLEVRGSIVAIGTITDSIKFVSNISTAKNSWDDIYVLSSTQNASGFFEYCAIKHSNRGISVEIGSTNSYVKHSFFENNNWGTWCTGPLFRVDSCTFINNDWGMHAAGTIVTNCNLENNSLAINAGIVSNCLIQNNGIGYNHEGWGSSISNSILRNNNIGIYIGDDSIMGNNIFNNTIGIQTDNQSYLYNGIQYYVPIKNNQICNNTIYNIENLNNYDKNITQNCFCTDDSTEIENKLYDGYDDITKGLFNYDIYDTACLNVIQSVYKIGYPPSSASSITENNLFTSFPNPVSEGLTVVFNNRIKKSSEIHLYNSVGEKIISTINNQNEILNINLNEFPNGLYLLQIKSDNIVKREKIIKI